MLQIQEKIMVCQNHEPLLRLLLRYGNGAMLLPQLRTLAVAMGLYSNGQAVNRAVRELKGADVLDRQTWIDNNSDLVLSKKFVLRYFTGKTSQETASPQRPRTMAPYILQARKIDWLLGSMDKYHLAGQMSVEKFINACACSLFFRRPELPAYYRGNAGVLSEKNPANYQTQLERLEGIVQPLPEVTTLEQMQRRGIYIVYLNAEKKTIHIVSFPLRETKPDRIMDWTIEAYQWAASLLPYYHMYHILYALDNSHREALKTALTAVVPGTTATHYWDYRLQGARLSGSVQIAVKNTDFVQKWCGGVHRTGL